jgi:hypothetical protein
MKVYEKIVIDMITGEVLEEVSYDYQGPIAECKGGGGGSSSGTVDFPAYMKTLHGEWLNRNGASVVAVGDSINELISAGLVASPYDGETAYNPDSNIAEFIAELATFKTIVDNIDPETDWISYATTVKNEVDTNIMDDTVITTVTNAHAAVLDDRLTTEVLPRFQVGMRDVNAVISSTFVIGQAVLEAFNTREVAEFDAKLRVAAQGFRNQLIFQGIDANIGLLQSKINFKNSVTNYSIEANRIKTVLKKEEIAERLDIEDNQYKWGLELYQHGGNILSSISGSSVNTEKKPNKLSSAVGGAVSGAAVGGMIGGAMAGGKAGSTAGYWGAGIGAVLGAAYGLMSE